MKELNVTTQFPRVREDLPPSTPTVHGTSAVFGRDYLCPRDIESMAGNVGPIGIDQAVTDRLTRARAVIASVIDRKEPAYGVNRGLGPLKEQEIPERLQHKFQLFVLASHDAAVGEPLSQIEARAVMLARLAVMAQGNSGVTRPVFEGLRALLERGITPAIPSEASVGSADLSAMASVGAVLVGRGRVLDAYGAPTIGGAEALEKSGLTPLTLAAKDALGLVGANAAVVGLASLASVRLDTFTAVADLAAAHTFEAIVGNVDVLAENVVAARPHPGQIRSAQRMRLLLTGGDLAGGLIKPGNLQDPLCFRTIPQVHGVLLEQADHIRDVVSIELNSRPENPYIDIESNSINSNGNFSTIRMALAFDTVRLAIAHVCMMSERRSSFIVRQLRSERTLVDQIESFNDSNHPLVPVILANTASSLVARIQQLAAPISHLGTAVGDGVEDHNAQAYSAVRLFQETLRYAEILLAVETLLATGISDLTDDSSLRRRGPLTTKLYDQSRAALAEESGSDSAAFRVERVRKSLLSLAGTISPA